MKCKAQMLSVEKLRKEIKTRADIVEACASTPTANIKQNPASGHVHINPQLNVYLPQFLLPNRYLDIKNNFQGLIKGRTEQSGETKQASEQDSNMT